MCYLYILLLECPAGCIEQCTILHQPNMQYHRLIVQKEFDSSKLDFIIFQDSAYFQGFDIVTLATERH